MLLREAIIGAYWEESNLFLQCWYLVMEGLRSFVGCDLKKKVRLGAKECGKRAEGTLSSVP